MLAVDLHNTIQSSDMQRIESSTEMKLIKTQLVLLAGRVRIPCKHSLGPSRGSQTDIQRFLRLLQCSQVTTDTGCTYGQLNHSLHSSPAGPFNLLRLSQSCQYRSRLSTTECRQGIPRPKEMESEGGTWPGRASDRHHKGLHQCRKTSESSSA